MAVNMGGANFAASFAAAFGGGILGKRQSALLFLFFVTIGAVCFGNHVALTLSHGIIPAELMTWEAVAIILLTAGLSLFISNLFGIPQSTSLVTVAAIIGVGLAVGRGNLSTLCFLLPFWVLLPITSFF